jgi:uncharacterized OsmC-like protein
MPSIESSGLPLVFKARAPAGPLAAVGTATEGRQRLALRAEVRSLEGMQKEALVSTAPGENLWRMVSDEGPYLNGTDLAPFPLGFFSAGMQFSLLSRIGQIAQILGIRLSSLASSQDNYYSMEGSFLRGDARGGASPPEVLIRVESDAPAERIGNLIKWAVASCPAQALMRDILRNTFSLHLNQRRLALAEVRPSAREDVEDPGEHFEALQPVAEGSFLPDILLKTAAADKVFGVEGGAGSSLRAEQKRTLHVHGEARLIEGFLMETEIRLIQPIGSTFRFRCDESAGLGGKESAPPPLAYLVAGVGFCYLTQLGRYAHIVKQDLPSYRIVQDNAFSLEGSAGEGSPATRAEAFDTHVFIEAGISEEQARALVAMGERTCFLHASMRGRYPCRVQAELNGKPL